MRERKRHTARHVASARHAVPVGGGVVTYPGEGGYLPWWGYLLWWGGTYLARYPPPPGFKVGVPLSPLHPEVGPQPSRTK